MDFFNSLTVRIPLAVVGGILYGLLAYIVVLLLDFPHQTAIVAGLLVFFLYLGSRLLVLFSGIDTPYYSKGRKGSFFENTSFYRTAQWVGKLYHYHDTALFVFLVILAIVFVISLMLDGINHQPFGQTIQNIWNIISALS
ncbi:MAG: hypothetical protein QME90_06970 [Thermodesulfobacteriota bacterium]|nr:hypothetical protein [Thermodesulfobacteriota bacterium]